MVSSSLRRVIRNAASILTRDVFSRATTFVIYLLVARHLGTFEFGQMSLALTLFFMFQVLAAAGLKTLITREVARDKTKTEQYFSNGVVVVTVFSLLSVTILLLFVWLMNYATETVSIILLLSLGLFPYSFSAICDGVFQAWERMHYIAYANVPSNIAKVSLAFLMLTQGGGLYHIVTLILAIHVTIAVMEWCLVRRCIMWRRMRIDLRFCFGMTKKTATFLGIDSIIAIWSSINILLLSKLATETEVGLFNAAVQLTMPVVLIFESIVLSIFPIMCRKFDASFQSLKKISEHLVELLLVIAMPTAVGLFFLADSVLSLLYGEEFLLASEALRILVWSLILRALTFALGQVLLASLREKITLRIVAINVLVNLVLGLILINRFGLIGAAITILLTGIVNFIQHYVPVSKVLSGIALGRLVWKPIVAATFMAACVALVGNERISLTIAFACGIYAGVFLALTIWSMGGFYKFKAEYQSIWS